ncbi:MAG: nuclear transport factor 2 family protein [Hyphomicrobiaceae bacterium]
MTLTAILKRFAAAVEAGNGTALGALFTENGVYDDYFFGPSEPGPEGVRDMLAHFYEGGEDFRWDFFDILEGDDLGYASYRFSYTSKLPEANGARVVFEGISRFQLRDGKIERYSEVFDRGMALAQQDFAAERIKKIGLRYANRIKANPDAARHTATAKS